MTQRSDGRQAHGEGAARTSPSSTPLRVAVAGARGRMGTLAVQSVTSASDLSLAAELTRGDDPSDVLDPARIDILLDLSHADASRSIVPLAARRGIAPVVGTSGLGPEDLDTLGDACRQGGTGGLVVPNFSIGAILQMQFAERLAEFFGEGAIREIHHPAKRDAPSGTARATAARMAQAARRRDASAREPLITSERTEGVLARQLVTVEAAGERLVIDHEVLDRSAYVAGMLLAIRAVTGLRGLHSGLDALLDGTLARASERLV